MDASADGKTSLVDRPRSAEPQQIGSSAANTHRNGAAAAAQAEEAQLPAVEVTLSAKWLAKAHDPASVPEVQAALDDLGVLSTALESEMVAAAAEQDAVLVKLFGWFGHQDIFRYVAYARAHLIRTGRVTAST
jgi:hypothetical protein